VRSRAGLFRQRGVHGVDRRRIILDPLEVRSARLVM
jgi:hypothetical protein